MSSGMNGQQFTFHGYLPIKEKERKNAIQRLESEALKSGYTQIFIETPYRNMQMFDSLTSTCQKTTLLSISSGLFSGQQFIKTYSIQQWNQKTPELHKIPTVFLLSRP
jgi:16S rRNA (cytidine1402-2'-O)-methyltransferase